MFWKKRKKEKVKYDVASENLAVPEVHTGEVEHTETDPSRMNRSPMKMLQSRKSISAGKSNRSTP